MAKKDNPKLPPTDPGAQSATKAQAGFRRYKTRVGVPQAGTPFFMIPAGFAPSGQAMPGWAVPPSLAMLSPAPGTAAYYPGMTQPGIAAGGSLMASLGSTIRLGVDVVNAALAGGARMLNGMSGMAYGYGEPWREHEARGCSSCCDAYCGSDCGGCDCCGGCEKCCQPSVGRCC